MTSFLFDDIDDGISVPQLASAKESSPDHATTMSHHADYELDIGRVRELDELDQAIHSGGFSAPFDIAMSIDPCEGDDLADPSGGRSFTSGPSANTGYSSPDAAPTGFGVSQGFNHFVVSTNNMPSAHGGHHTSPISTQSLSPVSQAPPMTDRDTRSPSTGPSTPGTNEFAGSGTAQTSANPLGDAIATARERSEPLPASSFGSYSGFSFAPDVASTGGGHPLMHLTGPSQFGAGYMAQPPINMLQGGQWNYTSPFDLSALPMPSFAPPGYGFAPPPPQQASVQGSYNIMQAPHNDAPSPHTRSDATSQVGVQRHNTRSQRRNHPIYDDQAAASGADLKHNNRKSTGAALSGGTQSNGAGRAPLSRARAEKKATKQPKQKSNKQRTKAPEHERTCTVHGCSANTNKRSEEGDLPVFSEKSALVRHLQEVHDRAGVVCPECRTRLSRGDAFHRHWKTFHDSVGKKTKKTKGGRRKAQLEDDEEDDEVPDETPSGYRKFDDDDHHGHGGAGMQWALGQPGPSVW